MPTYTKLFNSIISSTIWTEDDRTRIVWITMLALADQNGEIHASIPGLARLAAVNVEDVERALACFLGPDKYSRTKDFEGRRIAEIDGGWELLNHAKYRKMASKEDAKESNARRQQRHRKRNATVTHRNAEVTEGRDIAEADAEADKERERAARRTPTLAQCKSAAALAGMTEDEAEFYWHTREGSGWLKATASGGTTPIVSFQSDMATAKSWVKEQMSKQRKGRRAEFESNTKVRTL